MRNYYHLKDESDYILFNFMSYVCRHDGVTSFLTAVDES